MENDNIRSSAGVGSPPRLSVSSPGRLLVRPAEDYESASNDSTPPVSIKQHIRRESYSSPLSQYLLNEAIGEALGGNDDLERSLASDRSSIGFTPPPPSSSQCSVRRILRDGATVDNWNTKGSLPSSNAEPAAPILQFPIPSRPTSIHPSIAHSNGTDATRNPLKRESSILFSSMAPPPVAPNEQPSLTPPPPTSYSSDTPLAKHISCFSRIWPNIGLVLIVSTIWLVILVYGEYAYPHSHSQFCNTYLPKESLLGRVVIISNPHVAQVPLKNGFFDLWYNLKTRIDVFLSDFNMRRNYRILQEKCAPDAFVFSGTLIEASMAGYMGPDQSIDMIDEEAYIKLVRRWNWLFTKGPQSKFLYAPSIEDVAFQRMFSASNEVERRLMYQRFVDYFGPINWKVDVGPYTLASIFSPALDLPLVPSDDALRSKLPPHRASASISAQMLSETQTFLDQLEQEMNEKRSVPGRDFSPVVLLSPVPFYPDINATCLEWSSIDEQREREMEQVRHRSVSDATTRALLERFAPRLLISKGTLPRCSLPHPSYGYLQQRILTSISKHSNPGVFVLEARNATLIQNAGLSSLLTNTPGYTTSGMSNGDVKLYLDTDPQGTTTTSKNDPAQKSTASTSKPTSSHTAYELTSIFFDATTYMDMKGPYLWLAFMSILGCILSVETSRYSSTHSPTHPSDHLGQNYYTTSALIETLIGLSKFSALSIALLVRTIVSYTCARTPLKSCIPTALDLERGSNYPPPKRALLGAPSRTFRYMALKLQITIEILLICCVIVVPWCIFVMYHWM